MRFKLFAVLGLLCAGCVDRNIYVDSSAVNRGDGTKGKPFQTLVQARDAVRTARKSGILATNMPVTVVVQPGTYSLDASFELTAEDSGTAESPVIYRAAHQGKARITGGVVLKTSDFSKVTSESVLKRLDASAKDKVLMCDLSQKVSGKFESLKTAYNAVPTGPWLYVDQQPMTLARWPNADDSAGSWATFTNAVDTGKAQPDSKDELLRKVHPGSFVFEGDRPERWKLDDGVWLFGYWTHDWCNETIRMASYDKEKKVITMAAPHGYGIASGTWGASKRRFFALNLLEELDAPGEWYLDRTNKILYFYSPTMNENTLIVLATLNQPLVKMNDTKHVKFIGIAFEYVHSDGMILQKTEDVEIAGCEVSNCAGSGISVNGSRNIIRSCDLYNLGKGGISLNGGDRKKLTSGENLAVNNHVHDYGLLQRTYAAGIAINGCGQTMRNNCIHDAPHNAVLYSGNEHLLELNEIYRVVMETGDAGAFYTGRDWTSRGNVVRHNYFHDLGGGDAKHVNTMGVYLDDCDSGDTIEGNVFYRAGRAIMIGGGRDNPVLNNLVVDCPIALHMDSRGTTWKQWNSPSESSWHLEAKAMAMNYTNAPWSEKYPRLANIMNEDPQQPLGNTLRRNVFVDSTKTVCNFDANVKKVLDRLDIDENLVINTTGTNTVVMSKDIKGFKDISGTETNPVVLGFVNKAAGNFALLQDAWLLKELPTFQRIPFEKIGLYKDEYRRTLPVAQ